MELWIARSKEGLIHLFRSKPVYLRINQHLEDWSGGYMALLDSDSFPEVTFENSPQKVRLELVKEEEV